MNKKTNFNRLQKNLLSIDTVVVLFHLSDRCYMLAVTVDSAAIRSEHQQQRPWRPGDGAESEAEGLPANAIKTSRTPGVSAAPNPVRDLVTLCLSGIQKPTRRRPAGS